MHYNEAPGPFCVDLLFHVGDYWQTQNGRDTGRRTQCKNELYTPDAKVTKLQRNTECSRGGQITP
eukprot:scaffold263629_cov19-Prasinocladus_malaysianus.AAC.1